MRISFLILFVVVSFLVFAAQSVKDNSKTIRWILLGTFLLLSQNVESRNHGMARNGTIKNNQSEIALDLEVYDAVRIVEENNKVVSANLAANQGVRYIILRKDKSFGSQVTRSNSIYEIQYDYDLTEDIILPANCVLRFNGGRLGGEFTLYGNNTRLEAPLTQIFDNKISLGGTWIVPESYPEWFLSEGKTDFSEYADKLQIISNRVVLSGRYVTNGFILKAYHGLVINGMLNLNSTITLLGFCNVEGCGIIRVNHCYAFTCDNTQGVTRRIFVSGIKIVGENDNDGGFRSIGSSGGNNEIGFSTFNGLSFYKCAYGFKGFFGGNNIEAKFENCHISADIVGDFNNLTIQGQAPLYNGTNRSAFIIDGSYNTLRGRLWDIGSGTHQPLFAQYSTSSRNNSTDLMRFVESTNDSNGIFLAGNGIKVKMNNDRPHFTFTYRNIAALNAQTEAQVMKMNNPTWITINRVDVDSEGFIDIVFKTNTFFTSAIQMLFISPNYAFERVEMYIDDTLYQTRFGYGLSESITLGPTDWNTFYNKNVGTQIKLRCFVPKGGVRIRGTDFYM